MNQLSRISAVVLITALSGCGDDVRAKITDMATSCILDAYHQNHDIQTVENINIINFGSNSASSADKANGISSILPFDAEYSIILRSANGVWEHGSMHLEAVSFDGGGRQIRKVTVPGDDTYNAQLARFEPWKCDEPSKG